MHRLRPGPPRSQGALEVGGQGVQGRRALRGLRRLLPPQAASGQVALRRSTSRCALKQCQDPTICDGWHWVHRYTGRRAARAHDVPWAAQRHTLRHAGQRTQPGSLTAAQSQQACPGGGFTASSVTPPRWQGAGRGRTAASEPGLLCPCFKTPSVTRVTAAMATSRTASPAGPPRPCRAAFSEAGLLEYRDRGSVPEVRRGTQPSAASR